MNMNPSTLKLLGLVVAVVVAINLLSFFLARRVLAMPSSSSSTDREGPTGGGR